MSETFLDHDQVVGLIDAAHQALFGDDPYLGIAGLRFAAVVARRRGDPRLLRRLVRAYADLRDWDDDPRRETVITEALTKLVEARAGLDPAITALAHDPYADLRAAVAKGLVPYEEASRALLIELVRDRDPQVRGAARRRLGPWADAVPWWEGLLTTDPGADPAIRSTLERVEVALQRRAGVGGDLRADLDALPPAVALDLLEGLLSNARLTPIGERDVIAACVRAPGGLDMVCRVLDGWSPKDLADWRSWTAEMLTKVEDERRVELALALARRALALPRRSSEAERAAVPAFERYATEDVPGILAHWAAKGWPDGADPTPLFELLSETPVAPDQAPTRTTLARVLSREPGPPPPIAEALLRACAAADQAALAVVGGASVAEAIAAHAPPESRRAVMLARLETADREGRVQALLALLDDRLARPEDLAQLRAAVEDVIGAAEGDHAAARLSRHLLPRNRAALRAGRLDFTAAAAVMRDIAGRYGGAVGTIDPLEPPDESAPPLDLAPLEGPVGDLTGPPTVEEWARYYDSLARLREEKSEAWLRRWASGGVLPASAWSPRDWAVVEAAIEVLDDGPHDGKHDQLGWAVLAVLGREGSARAAALRARIRARGYEPAPWLADETDILGSSPAPEPAAVTAKPDDDEDW